MCAGWVAVAWGARFGNQMGMISVIRLGIIHNNGWFLRIWMRKKDKPVGLLVALGVLITGALVYNGAQSGLFKN